MKPRIVEYLKPQKAEERREAFIDELKKKYKTTIALRPPMVEVATGGRPREGRPNAPGHDHRVLRLRVPVLQARRGDRASRCMKTYGDKVRFVYRDYPLPFHAHARPAAEAGALRRRAGQVLGVPREAVRQRRTSTPTSCSRSPTEVGLDRTKFDECVAKEQFKDAIDKDIADGDDVGVNGTPAFFINGRMLSGAQPFEKFKEVIDEELKSSAQPKAS